MRRFISMLAVICLLIASFVISAPQVGAAQKATFSRHIGIVFDNSGSMYIDQKTDWCRATYAMEVFASMLNKGDTVSIYPMHPIEVEGKTYTMDEPFVITDASQSMKIREIYTPDAKGTPIETIDSAAKGIEAATADKKYMVVLTDGDEFYMNGSPQGKKTQGLLDNRFKPLISTKGTGSEVTAPEMSVMYLGVGKDAVIPSLEESEYFTKKHAAKSEDVLSSLTDMCNQIFGRDTLPKNHINGNTIDFDISMSKVIVFVQGENVSGLKVTGASGEMGTLASSKATKYSTKGCGKTSRGDTKAVPDTSLQGMMVTYTDCAAGQYKVEYTGKATSVEVYYEPDADLDFIFTDADGNDVDPKELYEGDYKVSFGMKDAKTGQLIESDLLGNPHYEGSYSINGQEVAFKHDGLSGEVPISLKKDDTFEAKLTAMYLNGYTISKDSTDFGWPKGGIKVAPLPAGKLRVEISGGDTNYSLQKLEKGAPYTVKIYYQGEQLTGAELQKVKLTWDANTSYAGIKQQFADDHIQLLLTYKDPNAPQNTMCGRCKVKIEAAYTAPGSEEATANRTLTYSIDEDLSQVKMQVSVPQDYIVIKELGDSKAITVKFLLNGQPMTSEEFARVKFAVACDKIEHTVTADEKTSSYVIKLKETKGISEGEYPIGVSATYTDFVGRTTDCSQNVSVKLSNTPLWLKWLIWILILIALIVIIVCIARIKVLPKRVTEDGYTLVLKGKDVSDDPGAECKAKKLKTRVEATAIYDNSELTVYMNKVIPGNESFLCKAQKDRSFVVDPKLVDVSGNITNVSIDGTQFIMDKHGGFGPADPEQEPFEVSEGASITIEGYVDVNGISKKLQSTIPITFEKRK